MSKQKCPYAIRRKGRIPIDCEIAERESSAHKFMPCAFQRYCPKEGRSILTPGALGCVRRKDRKETKEPTEYEKNGFVHF